MRKLLPHEKQINALDEGEAILADKQQPATVEDAMMEIKTLDSCIKKVEEVAEKYDDTEFALRLSSLKINLNKRKKSVLNAKLSIINNY